MIRRFDTYVDFVCFGGVTGGTTAKIHLQCIYVLELGFTFHSDSDVVNCYDLLGVVYC